MISARRLAAALLAVVSGTGVASGLKPVSHYHDLVAGAGEPGFEDGEFYRARFNAPAGLAFIASRAVLFASDRNNNRIRAVRLAENNRVEVLAGKADKGRENGALDRATFNAPTAMASVSDRFLVVNDEGNALFRMIDLEKRSVETLAGNSAQGVAEGPATSVPLGRVWNLVYFPAENAIYFSQPDFHALRRLDLASRVVTTVLQNDTRIPNPAALVLFGEVLCVADRGGRVFKLERTGPSGPAAPARLTESWKGQKILAMAASDDRLYALQAERDPAWTCLSRGRDVPVPSIGGEVPGKPYLRFAADEAVAFVPDTRAGRSFFITSSSLNSVICLKEYRFGELSVIGSESGTGLRDFDYPARKPERTFRILLLGDSRTFYFGEGATDKRDVSVRQPGPMDAIPKRLELMLNTLAALDGADSHYEVLLLAHDSWWPLLVWPVYEVPALVGKFDIDLVLLMLPPSNSTLDAYLQRPIGANGIPANQSDPEYLLEPFATKMQGNPAAKLVARSQTLGWVHTRENGQVWMDDFRLLITDRVVREELLALYARPLKALKTSLDSARPSGKTGFTACYFPLGMRGSAIYERSFWKELGEREKLSWLDLVDPLTVLRETWYPITDGSGHFTTGGHALFAFVLAHELIQNGVIPFHRSQPAPARHAALNAP